MRLKYFPIKRFFAEFGVVYIKQFNSTAQKSENSSANLTGTDKKEVRLDWSGYRIEAGIGMKINIVK